MSMAKKGISSLVYTYLGTLGRTAVQFVLGVVLARLLTPETFGLVAVAWIVVGFGNAFADAGLTSFIVQRADISDQDVAQTFWSQVAFGAFMTCLVFVFSPFLSQILGDERARPILQAMSALFFLKALGQTSYALMARNGRFGAIQTIGFTSYLLCYGVVAVVMALAGLGPWSIVAAAVSQTLVSTIAQILIEKPNLKLIKLWPPSTEMYIFGSKATLSGFLGLMIYNIDNIAISRAMGATSLGIYNRCINLVNMPMQVVNQLNSVILTFASKVQHRKDVSANIYLSMNTAYSATVIPMMLVVAAFPSDVITGLYGDNWAGAIPVLRPMAVAICFSTLSIPCSAMLMSLDRTSLEIRAQLITIAFLVVLAFSSSRISLEYFAWGIAVVYLVRLVASVVAVCSELKIPAQSLFKSIAMPSAVSIFPLAISIASKFAWNPQNPELRLISLVLLSAGGLCIGLLLLGPLLARGPVLDLLRRNGALPSFLARWLNISAPSVVR